VPSTSKIALHPAIEVFVQTNDDFLRREAFCQRRKARKIDEPHAELAAGGCCSRPGRDQACRRPRCAEARRPVLTQVERMERRHREDVVGDRIVVGKLDRLSHHDGQPLRVEAFVLLRKDRHPVGRRPWEFRHLHNDAASILSLAETSEEALLMDGDASAHRAAPCLRAGAAGQGGESDRSRAEREGDDREPAYGPRSRGAFRSATPALRPLRRPLRSPARR